MSTWQAVVVSAWTIVTAATFLVVFIADERRYREIALKIYMAITVLTALGVVLYSIWK